MMDCNNTLKTSLHYIAFIDILGSKNMIYNDEIDSLNLLHHCYQTTITLFSKIFSSKMPIPSFKIFSDNIVVSLKYNESNYIHSMSSLICFCSIFQYYCFSYNILTRGGITLGYYFTDELMVWGKGLVSAYKLESTIACYPRIILDPLLNDVIPHVINIIGPHICKDNDNLFYIDFLPNKFSKNWKFKIDTYIYNISQRISENQTNPQVLQKLEWVENFLMYKKNSLN